MVCNAAYCSSEGGTDDTETNKKDKMRTVNGSDTDEKIYTYDEAINLAGNGVYSFSLLATLSIVIMAMGVDLFGLSVIVTGAKCELGLDLDQTGILLSMSFIGPIVMAYPWGYISDTQGRKKSLLISLWSSFLVTTISAFSPNWVVLAVLKFISTSFCSCAQSASYTLLGECSVQRVRDSYILVMGAILDFCLPVYVGIGYFILNMDFSYDLSVITFTPWRLLIIALALPLGIGAFGMHFFYESPKFLVNAGREEEALDRLRRIWKRNGGETGKYPVKKIFLNEEGNERRKDVSFLHSLWQQIMPLFKPPLLLRSLQLYFLTAVVFGTNNSYYIWLPYLAEKFLYGFDSSSADADQPKGLCSIITSTYYNSTENVLCPTKMEISLVWISLAQGVSVVIILLGITMLSRWKRSLVIVILLVSSACGVGAVAIPDNIISFIMFFGLMLNELIIGIVFAYFVELYPTSYRGMAACLNVMVARGSALGGTNLLGAFIMSHCSTTFYVCSVLMICGVIVSCMLPPDKPRK